MYFETKQLALKFGTLFHRPIYKDQRCSPIVGAYYMQGPEDNF